MEADVSNTEAIESKLRQRLQQRLLLSARLEGDRLVLSDAAIVAALDGSLPLNAEQRAALQASPLTMRRLRVLAIERKARGAAANDDHWHGSAGMLRAAADGAALTQLSTDDGHWRLHFVDDAGQWRVIVALDAAAPFAARLMREAPMLRVVDGGGAIVLQGRLDADGECESAWPFETAPAPHFHEFGARFAVEPVHG